MRWPWISRDSHDETVKLLQEQIADLKRVIDQFAMNGLGYPLYSLPPASLPEAEPEEELIDPQKEINEILTHSRRPSLMAQAIKQYAIKEKKSKGPSVARIPKINEALDRAEAEGRKQG